jgi:CheY-like chemotaxis protein
MTLWIVDDLAQNRDCALRSAAAAGWPAQAFASGAAALAARAAGGRPAVVLLDYDLGGERGDRVCAAWRTAETDGAVAILVGYSSSPACSEAIVRAGADTVLPKRSDGSGRNPAVVRFLQSLRRD